VLHAIEVPPCGGDTLWANQILAYETLPDDLKTFVTPRRAVHLGAPYGVKFAPPEKTRSGRSIRMTRGDPKADIEQLHPAVRTHPRSARKALFLNPIYTTRFEDMSVEESTPILGRLYSHMTRPEFSCRHRWQAGDLVIWDNRTTLHFAVNDYGGYRRLLHRTTFAGEVPV
jgi:taurine dioxygenase